MHLWRWKAFRNAFFVATVSAKSAAQAYLAIVELGQPILVHCASGNRVGALIALADYWLNGVGNSEALAHGLQAGLTKLEKDVRQVLQC